MPFNHYNSQDSVRLLAVESFIAIASLLSNEQRKELLKPGLLNLVNDKSWRVRCMVAEKFNEVGVFSKVVPWGIYFRNG